MDTDINNQIIEAMFSFSRVMKGEMQFSSDHAKLSMLQIQILLYINQEKQVQMKDLASNFTITLPTATSLSDNLIKDGLIQRNRSTQDRRVVTLTISKKGNDILKKIKDKRNEKMKMLLSYLSEKQKEDFLSILTSLKENIEKKHEK